MPPSAIEEEGAVGLGRAVEAEVLADPEPVGVDHHHHAGGDIGVHGGEIVIVEVGARIAEADVRARQDGEGLDPDEVGAERQPARIIALDDRLVGAGAAVDASRPK